jgi:glycosyltransferase involved in cell wall biosynthesis
MKILFVSMPSVHVIRWIENLKDTSYELFWFDVLGRGKLETLNSVTQFVDWKKRKVQPIKGEYFLSKKFPTVYEKVQPYLEVNANEALESILLDIKPDVVHSFEMHYCSFPILKTMSKFKHLKWIYSCWGSDIFRHQILKSDIIKIVSVLKRVNYLITDCYRDYNLALKYGFDGSFEGVIPGGGGYHIQEIKANFREIESRKLILIKGNHNETGRAIFTLKAIKKVIKELEGFKIYVFSARTNIVNFVKSDSVLNKKIDFIEQLTQLELFDYFGKSFIYIGNNISDGMPNTLLQALLLGAYPIQSNPGNATKELIGNKYFGSIIDNPENPDEIANKILNVIKNRNSILPLVKLNHENAVQDYDHVKIKEKVIEIYNQI